MISPQIDDCTLYAQSPTKKLDNFSLDDTIPDDTVFHIIFEPNINIYNNMCNLVPRIEPPNCYKSYE